MNMTSKRLKPFRGKVNVMFRDAMVASTDDAIEVREPGRPTVYFIPFEHIYFEFLHEEPKVGEDDDHPLRYWSVSAVGEAAPRALRAFDAPPVELGDLREHGAFDPAIVTVEAMETPDREHRVHLPD